MFGSIAGISAAVSPGAATALETAGVLDGAAPRLDERAGVGEPAGVPVGGDAVTKMLADALTVAILDWATSRGWARSCPSIERQIVPASSCTSSCALTAMLVPGVPPVGGTVTPKEALPSAS